MPRVSAYRVPRRPEPPIPLRWVPPPRTAQKAPLAQFVLLSMLLHAMFILLFGAPSGGSREGRAMWGSLQVELLGPPREVAPAPRIEVPIAPPRVERPRATSLEPEVAKEIERTAIPAPRPAEPFSFPPLIERIVTPDRTLEMPPPLQLPPPTATQLVAPPPPAPPEPKLAPQPPAPPAEALVPKPAAPEVPIALPVIPIPPPIERVPIAVPVLPALAPTPPVERPPIETPTLPAITATPPVERPPVEVPAIPVPKPESLAPPRIEPAPAPTPAPAPVEKTPARELPATPRLPPTLERVEPRAPPALRPEPVEAPAKIEHELPAPEAPSPRPSPFRSPPPSTDSSTYDPTLPRIDLDAVRNRAGEIAREGSGRRAILPFPMPPVPEKKTKMQTAIENARKPDCRTAYSDLGLAAIVPLIANEFGEGKCKW